MNQGFFKITNLSNLDISSFEKLMKDFLQHAQKTMGFDQPVEVQFVSDPENAKNPLGKTAWYDPANSKVAVYVDNRHPKDIMRSLSHELVHHTQNCRGDFDNVTAMGEGYAQSDEHLREMEREAYETGNLCFRDWEDNLKTNKKKETIYIKLMNEGLKRMSDRKKLLKETIRKILLEQDAASYCADTGANLTGAAGSTKIASSKFNQAVNTTTLEEDEYEGYTDDGMAPAWLDSGAGGGLLDRLIQNLRIHEGPWTRTAIREMVLKELDTKQHLGLNPGEGSMNETRSNFMKEKKGWGSLNTLNEGWDRFLMSERSDKRKQKWMQAFQNAAGNPQPPPQDFWDTATYLYNQGEDPVAAGEKYAANNMNEGYDAGKAVWMEKFKLHAQLPQNQEMSDDWSFYANQAYRDGKDPKQTAEELVASGLKEYGDHETQAKGGLVASSYSSDPAMDQVEDIALDVIGKGGSLMQIATALKDEGFDANVSSGALMIQGTSREKFFIGKESNFEIGPEEETRQIGPYILGYMDSSMNEGITADGKEFNIGDMVQVTGGGASGATGEIIEFAEGKAVVRLETDADRRLFGQATDEIIVRGEHLALMGGMNEMYGEDDDYFDALEAEFPFLAKSVKAGEVPEEVAAEIAKEYSDKEQPQEEPQLQEISRRSMLEAIIKKTLVGENIDPSQFPNPLPKNQKGEAFLSKGLQDGDRSDDIVAAGAKSIPAADAKPSQSAIYLGKALGMAVGGVKGGNLSALISADNYILDGHHRWAATMFSAPDAAVSGTGIEMPMAELIPVLRAAGDAYGNARRGEPAGGDVNIFKASIDDAMSAIEKIDGGTKFTKEGAASKWLESIGGQPELQQRLEAIKAKGAAVGGAPPRAEMPVIDADKGEDSNIATRLNKGAIDVNPPYADPATDDEKEKEAIPMGMKESREKRVHNERYGLLMERMLGITNLQPLNSIESRDTTTNDFKNWLFEEDEEDDSNNPLGYCEDEQFLSAQEAEKEALSDEEEENYSKSEIDALHKRPEDLKNN